MDTEIDFSTMPIAISQIRKVNQIITTTVNGDRAHDLAKSQNISEAGVAAELAGIFFLRKSNQHFKHVTKLWIKNAGNGRNCGADLRAEWLGSDKHVEIKSTPSITYFDSEHQSILFMRTQASEMSRIPSRMPKAYWEQALPDSYYILLKQVTLNNNFHFKALGWADKELMLRYYNCERDQIPNSRVFETTLNHGKWGYPTICIGSKYLYPMSDLLVKMY